MTKDTALDFALEALRSAAAELYTASSYCNTYEVLGNTNDAITAIQQARAAPVQEPVGYVAENGVVDWNVCAPPILTDLYTTPPAQPAPTVQEWMKPHPKCDQACLFQCTKGFTQFPECATTPPVAQRQWVGLSDAQNTVIWANSQSIDEAIRATEKQLMENNI